MVQCLQSITVLLLCAEVLITSQCMGFLGASSRFLRSIKWCVKMSPNMHVIYVIFLLRKKLMLPGNALMPVMFSNYLLLLHILLHCGQLAKLTESYPL